MKAFCAAGSARMRAAPEKNSAGSCELNACRRRASAHSPHKRPRHVSALGQLVAVYAVSPRRVKGATIRKLVHIYKVTSSSSVFPRKLGRPVEGGPNTLAGCESADVRDPFLSLCLG